MQSTNEELETAKEELQSTNEELTTLNEELKRNNDELNSLNDDLTNLLRSVALPVVMLGRDLRIRRFTPAAQKLFKLIASDVGRAISDIKADIEVPDLEKLVREVIDNLCVKELELRDRGTAGIACRSARTRRPITKSPGRSSSFSISTRRSATARPVAPRRELCGCHRRDRSASLCWYWMARCA